MLDCGKLVQYGYDMLWDTAMCKFICNHYSDGTKFVEQKANEKGVKLRLVVKTPKIT